MTNPGSPGAMSGRVGEQRESDSVCEFQMVGVGVGGRGEGEAWGQDTVCRGIHALM